MGASFHRQSVETIGTVSSLLFPTDGLWRGAIYNLQPAAVLAVERAAGERASANPFFVSSPPTTAYLIWALAWVAAVLGIAAWSFRRREL